MRNISARNARLNISSGNSREEFPGKIVTAVKPHLFALSIPKLKTYALTDSIPNTTKLDDGRGTGDRGGLDNASNQKGLFEQTLLLDWTVQKFPE
ncbi:MAG: hypothetical protein ACYC7D_15040 [Nitrososphaerales archaeon]